MRVALLINWFMLVLEGGMAWRAGGSPFLLIGSMVVVFLYALLGTRSGRVAEFASLVASAALVTLCLRYHGDDPNVSWLCLLALPHILAVTHFIWELQHAGAAKDDKFIEIRRVVPTLGFYASLGLAFLMLRADLLKWDRSTGMMLAVVISLLGLVAWEAGRVRRLKKGEAAGDLSGKGAAVRIALVELGVVVFALIFAVALPVVSDALCRFSYKPEFPRHIPESGSERLSATLPGSSYGTRPGEESDSDSGTGVIDHAGPSRLPVRGTLKLSEEVRVELKFGDPAQAKTLTGQGPLYVRTLAAGTFQDDQWISEGPPGYRLEDAVDGKLDGRVEVGKPVSGEIAHEIFLPHSTGHALPALAGVTAYALPDLMVLPDDWFQNTATGDIRYKAWSRPVNILWLSSLKLKPGTPGKTYTNKLSTPFGTRLTEIADSISTKRQDLSGRLDLLRQYFQSGFTYSTTIENISGLPPLENFLFEEKRGYCDFFASAAALILRHMNIPSRVAYGYMEGGYDAATDRWIFRGLHAHAWTEVFVEDLGWVICDFTPPSGNSSTHSGSPPPVDLAGSKDAPESGTDHEIKLWDKTQSLQSLGVPAIAGLVLLGVIVGFLLRKRLSPAQWAAETAARQHAKRDQQPEYFLEFLRMCATLGHTRLKGQTLMEFLRHLKRSRFCDDDFDDLADYYYKSRYADAPRNDSSEQEFFKRIQEFRKARIRETGG